MEIIKDKNFLWLHLVVSVILLFTSTISSADFSATWERKNDASPLPSGPGSRVWYQLAYDTVNQKTVIYGGGAKYYRNDMWYYDSIVDSWTGVEPQVSCPMESFTPPPPADEHVFAYDSHNHLYWTFGGAGYKCLKGPIRIAESGTTIDTLVDNTLDAVEPNYYKDWTVSIVGGPPYGRKAYVQTYDPNSKSLTLATPISGLEPGVSYQLHTHRGSGTFFYDPVTGEWTGFDGPHWGYTGPLPPNRFSPGFAYSTADRALVMFGGRRFNDTWAMDVETMRWIKMNSTRSSAAPPARSQIENALVYDSANDVFILYGGYCQDRERCDFAKSLDDTWTYKLSTNTWTKMNPLNSPPPRLQHQMAYDSANQVVVLFSGRSTLNSNDASVFYNDTWVYDYQTNTWIQLSTSGNPVGRSVGSMVYDSDKGIFITYGGKNSNGNIRGELWTLRLERDGGQTNQDPIAVFSVTPSSGDTDTTFVFDPSSSSDPDGSIVSYNWNFGDSNTSNENAPSHQYLQPGIYFATLTVTDNDGASNSTALELNISAVGVTPRIDLSTALFRGTVNDTTITEVKVNGISIPVSGSSGQFEFEQPLTSSETTVNIEATNSQGVTGITTLTISKD